ncbi:MAG TPA: hypothetical protein PL089_14945 [Ignavibacteria bacterium]|nr:hypothetical protein [Ignavibacteria bacterium]
MISNVLCKNIFKTHLKHIAFAINTDGINDEGIAGKIASMYIPKFSNTGERKLGDVVTITFKGKSYHGLVCHSLSPKGWKNSPTAIKRCIDKIRITDNDEIAIVLLGAGKVGKRMGADIKGNLRAINRSKKKCVVYTIDYSQEEVLRMLK